MPKGKSGMSMTKDPAHKQNIAWLKEQLTQQESKLAKAEALVVQLRASVAHFRGVLEVVASDQEKQTSTNSLLNALAEDERLNGGQTAANVVFEEYKSEEDESQHNPHEMKHPALLGKTFAEAAQKILDKHQNSQDLKRMLSRGKHSP
jgi:serine/threonine protein phosphatase PrpC